MPMPNDAPAKPARSGNYNWDASLHSFVPAPPTHGVTGVTEREAVERGRAAFVEGWCARQASWVAPEVRAADRALAWEAARERYPLPRTTRPRVVRGGWYDWRIVNDRLEWRTPTNPSDVWEGCALPLSTLLGNAEYRRALARLLAEPTETVDDDA